MYFDKESSPGTWAVGVPYALSSAASKGIPNVVGDAGALGATVALVVNNRFADRVLAAGPGFAVLLCD